MPFIFHHDILGNDRPPTSKVVLPMLAVLSGQSGTIDRTCVDDSNWDESRPKMGIEMNAHGMQDRGGVVVIEERHEIISA